MRYNHIHQFSFVAIDMPRISPGGPRDAVVNVRVPERVKFGLSLMSRMYHEPIPDIIIRALEDAFTSENGGLLVDVSGEEQPKALLPLLWDPRPAVRFVKLALHYPALLTRPEQKLWQRIEAEQKYWQVPPPKSRKQSAAAKSKRGEADLLVEVLEADWAALQQMATGSVVLA